MEFNSNNITGNSGCEGFCERPFISLIDHCHPCGHLAFKECVFEVKDCFCLVLQSETDDRRDGQYCIETYFNDLSNFFNCEGMNATDEYSLHIRYQFHRAFFKENFNKLYYCKWTTVKGCSNSNGSDPVVSSCASGSTESVETTGRQDELVEFVSPVPILYNYDDDVTVCFELFCAKKPMSSSAGSDSRRNSDSTVRFRSSSEVLFWESVDYLECELNAVIHRGRLSEKDDGRIREGSSGRFTVISERIRSDRCLSEKQIHMEVSISQLEKRGKMKYTDLETYLAIHRKSLEEDQIIVYRSTKTVVISSSSLQKFPEIIISYERLLGGTENCVIYFTLRNVANGDVIGEAHVFYPSLIADGKVNLKLRSRGSNTNVLLGVSKRSFHPVGVLHVNLYMDNKVMNSSRNSTECRHQSSAELPLPLNSIESPCLLPVKSSNKEKLDFSHSSGFILASGRTQAYLMSLLAPTIEVRLRQPIIRPIEPSIKNNFCGHPSSSP